MNEFLKIAVEAATSAGEYIKQSAHKIERLKITEKSVHDYVSEVDRHSEIIITDLLAKNFPEHRVLGEEHGRCGNDSSDYQWIIDPLDGTTNFLRSIPHYAISIALLHKGEIVIGVVYDVPKSELFYACKGQGAFLNQVEINVSQKKSFQGSLLATGVPFNGENLEKISSFTTTMESLLALQTSGIRRLGAAALDLAYIACGRYDGFWEANLQSWDIAAGALLVKEAGGVVTDLNGGNEYLKSGNILAACKQVHAQMLVVTSRCYEK
ncbi:UNVERIFIED_CONTAM: hypothetical protein GTU68_032404 [Idotea baltica]|nr:hypothetical protein [Idotea baltica]